MNSESLIKALTNLPSDAFDFDDVNFDETHHHDDEVASVDSLGSCCNSPNQSSDGSLSSCEDADSEYFIFPNKNKLSQNGSSQSHSGHNNKGAGEPDTKLKRKLECKVKRNERERRRVRRLADGFRKLREVVPGNYKKLSKLDTLKRALDYMATLADVLDTQRPVGGFDHQQYSPEATFIKTERQQFVNDFASSYSHHSLPYQNTISYQPMPTTDWSMYQQHEKQLSFPPNVHHQQQQAFYEQQQQIQRSPFIMSYQQQQQPNNC